MYQLAQESAQVFVLVYMVVTGEGYVFTETPLKGGYTRDACIIALAEQLTALKSAPEPMRLVARFECRPAPKKPG